MAGPSSNEYSFSESPATPALDKPTTISPTKSSGRSDGSDDKALVAMARTLGTSGNKALPALPDRDAGSNTARPSTPRGERGGGASTRRLPRGEGERDRLRYPALVPLELTEGNHPHAQGLLLNRHRMMDGVRVREARDGVDALPLTRVTRRAMPTIRVKSLHGNVSGTSTCL